MRELINVIFQKQLVFMPHLEEFNKILKICGKPIMQIVVGYGRDAIAYYRFVAY